MSNHYSQLRFDISEKVSLHPQQLGISRLVELDLYPDVKIQDEGQHLKIQGYLRLNGSYLGEGENPGISSYSDDPEELAYVIPVEITLPSDRAELSYISAEIEQFDYQVLSPYELQIEAILMIDGILPEEQEEIEPKEAVVEEPFFRAEPAQATEEIPHSREETPQINMDQNPSTQEMKILHRPERNDADYVAHEHSKGIIEEHESNVDDVEQVGYVGFSTKTFKDAKTNVSSDPEGEVVHPFPVEAKQPELDQKFEKFPLNEPEEQPVFVDEPEPKKERFFELGEDPKGVNEWSHWLVRNREETFTAMRLVIVQKEDSLASLAERYAVPASRLLHHNHLHSDELEEGQIVCIPNSD